MTADTGGCGADCPLCISVRAGDLPGDYAHYLAARLGPRFIRAYRCVRNRRRNPRPLCIDGHEYRRRQKSRQRRKR